MANVKSCTMFAPQADGCELFTVEGLIKEAIFIPCRQASRKARVAVWLFTPGMLISSFALLQKKRHPAKKTFAGDFRQPLPLHRIPEHRQGVQYAAGKMSKEEQSECKTSPEIGGMGHPIKRKEDFASSRAKAIT